MIKALPTLARPRKLDEKDAGNTGYGHPDTCDRANPVRGFLRSQRNPTVAHIGFGEIFSQILVTNCQSTKSEEVAAELEKEIAELEQQLGVADANLSEFEQANARAV